MKSKQALLLLALTFAMSCATNRVGTCFNMGPVVAIVVEKHKDDLVASAMNLLDGSLGGFLINADKLEELFKQNKIKLNECIPAHEQLKAAYEQAKAEGKVQLP